MNLSGRPLIVTIEEHKILITLQAAATILLEKGVDIEDFANSNLEQKIKLCKNNISIEDLRQHQEGILIYCEESLCQ